MSDRNSQKPILNVMIVDDEMIVRTDIRNLMDWEQHRYRIAAEAENGLEACRIIGRTPIDIIIADIQMPELNGLDMASRILEKKPDMKFIFLTAYSDFEFVRTSMRLGINSYILKHEIDEEVLCRELDRLREQLERSSAAWREEEAVINAVDETESPRISENFEAVREYVEQNFQEDISLESMASRFHVSESYLSHLFTQQIGMSFKSYLKQIRMEYAGRCLLDGDIRIADLAGKTGYSSSQYFFQVFKQYFKMTPTEYLRRYGREKE